MVTIPGASGYLNAATLANQQGLAAQSATLLGTGGNTQSLLDAGRGISGSGIGLSASARALNNEFLSSSASTFNQIFSLGIGSSATIEGLQQSILALRASLPESAIRIVDDGSVADSETGQEIDTEA